MELKWRADTDLELSLHRIMMMMQPRIQTNANKFEFERFQLMEWHFIFFWRKIGTKDRVGGSNPSAFTTFAQRLESRLHQHPLRVNYHFVIYIIRCLDGVQGFSSNSYHWHENERATQYLNPTHLSAALSTLASVWGERWKIICVCHLICRLHWNTKLA